MKSVVILSGGLDSSVLLYYLLHQGDEVKALSIDYGQRHFKELASAAKIAVDKAEHKIASLSQLRSFLGGSSQTSKEVEVPEGHYEDETMKLTVVPNRNMLLLSIATAWAVSLKYDSVAYGAHLGDHAVYPDCRPAFIIAMAKAMELCSYEPIRLVAPFQSMTKAEIVGLGNRLKVPFEDTWSCYKGGKDHCGRCGTCVERRAAFVVAKVKDPTSYEVPWEETLKLLEGK